CLSRDRALARQHRTPRRVERSDGGHCARPRSCGDPGRHGSPGRGSARRRASRLSVGQGARGPRERRGPRGRTRGVDRARGAVPWELQLSAHEQQLLAISRALLQQPEWLLLDEATSGLDEPTERKIYDVLLERLPRTGVIAAGLRPRAMELMPHRWTLSERDGTNVLLAA